MGASSSAAELLLHKGHDAVHTALHDLLAFLSAGQGGIAQSAVGSALSKFRVGNKVRPLLQGGALLHIVQLVHLHLLRV